MTKRMARMHAMMTMPPTTTSREAHRSARMRRSVRARLTTSGRAGDAGPPAVKVSLLMATSLDLRQLFLRDRGGDREVTVLDDTLLPLLGDDHLHEFPRQRIERLAGRLVDVDEEEAGHRIGPGVRVVGGGLHTLAGVLVVTVLHHVLFEEAVGAGGGVAAIEADGLLGPLTAEPELPPRVDVLLVARAAGLGEDRVHLAHAEALDRVVLVDEHREGIDGGPDGQRLVAELLLELVDLRPSHLA